jgi:hypothetical protein
VAKVNCSKCRKALPSALLNEPGLKDCPYCNAKTQVWTFPALVKPPEAPRKEDGFKFEDDAACFYHPTKRAVVPCSWCGRFLCSLCDVDFNDEHVCPACLVSGKQSHKVKRLETQRMLYDNLAMALAIWPMLIFYFTVITAPAVLFVVFRYYKAPSSVLPRTKVRFYIAGFIALLQIAGWVTLLVFLLS